MVQLRFLDVYNVEFFPRIFSSHSLFVQIKYIVQKKKLNSFEITLCSSLVRKAKSSLESSSIANKFSDGKEKKE